MLLRAAALELDDAEINELVERTEGWAAGLYLTALAARAEGDEPRADVLSVDRRRPLPRRLLPLRVPLAARARAADVPSPHARCSRRCRGPLCDAVLDRQGLGARARLARAGEPVRRPARPPPRLLPLPPPLPRAAPAGARGARAGARAGAQPARGRLVRGAGRPGVDARLLARGRQRGERRAHPQLDRDARLGGGPRRRRSSRGSTASTTTTLERHPGGRGRGLADPRAARPSRTQAEAWLAAAERGAAGEGRRGEGLHRRAARGDVRRRPGADAVDARSRPSQSSRPSTRGTRGRSS